MASGAQVSEEAGGVGGGGIGVEANQVAEETGGDSTNQLNGEAGRVGEDIGVSSSAMLNGDVERDGDEIGVSTADQVSAGEAGDEGGENGVASVNQDTGKVQSLNGEIGVAAAQLVNGEPTGEGSEIGVAAVNQVTEEAVGLDGKTEVASASQVAEEKGGVGGENGLASTNQVAEVTGGVVGENGASSVNLITRESGDVGADIRLSAVNDMTEEAGALCCENGETSMKVNAGPGGEGVEIGAASADKVNGEPGGEGGEIRVADEVHRESGAADGEVRVADKVKGERGGGGGEIMVASADQVNGEPGGRAGEISVADKVNGEPGDGGGDIMVASLDHVNGELGGGGVETKLLSAKQVNEVAGRVRGELEVGEKYKWAETKVYRRRPKVEKNKCVLSDLEATAATTVIMDIGNKSENNKHGVLNTHESNHIDANHKNNQVDETGVVESEKFVSVPAAGENVNLNQIQPETMGDVILNKQLASARINSQIQNPIDPPVTNGALTPPYSASDSKVKISLSSTAKPELRQLKRKFESELYSVRKAVKKMDGSMEVNPEFFQHVDSSAILNGARSNGFASQDHSGTRSLVHVPYKPNIRPFNQLRVSVFENGHSMADSFEREKRTPKENQFYRNSEFLLANDKFPPTESNKKSKSNVKKSSGGEFGFGVGSKVYKSCSVLLEKLMKHKHGWVFNAPVDVKGLGLHDYFLIIKNPMDLGTVKAKLIKYWYKSPMEFAEDIRLTFHNAMMYNPKGHDVHIMAETLLKIFEGKWPDIEVKYLRELRMAVEPDMGYPTPTSRITNPFQSPTLPSLETRVFNRSESLPHPVNSKPRTLTSAPSFRAPALKKPKAKDVNKRDMTYDEKQKLSTNLQILPPEKLDGVIQIIKKRSTALSQNDDEIEVDIDSVDTETLWELDRFVTNYKKSLSKYRRKAELANQMRDNASRQAAEKITAPQSMPPKESAAGNGNAALSLPPHQNDPAVNPTASSSSSSSSSSGSSSSDSDSDSSSEESDGGHSPGT